MAAVSLLIRLALRAHSFDFFGDEIIYAKLGESVATGGFPRFGGRLFFLHGPTFFYLEAGWQHLVGGPPDIASQILRMRVLNTLAGGASGAAVVLLAARASNSVRLGLGAGLLFAADPFCIRQNDRVLLETSMMLWVLLGYLVLMPLITRPPSRAALRRAVGAGLLFGVAVLTKDEAALLTVLPVLAMAVLRWAPNRAACLAASTTTVLVYGGYLVTVAANGDFDALWAAKTSGLQRMLGLLQTTGFHRTGALPVYVLLLEEARWFAITYLTLLLAVPVVVLVIRRGGPVPRMLGLLYSAAGVTLGYALLLGTLEEQELYLLLIPSILVLPVGAHLAGIKAGRRRRARAPARRPGGRYAATVTLLIAAAVIDLTVSADWLSRPDDGYLRLLRYMEVHVPAGSAVTAFDGTTEDGITQYALAGRYRVGRWASPAARRAENVRYAVVPWTEIQERYSYYSLGRVRSIVDQGKVLFSFHGRTYGDLVLYKLPVAAPRVAARREPSCPAFLGLWPARGPCSPERTRVPRSRLDRPGLGHRH